MGDAADRLALETAINDAKGDALLLELAADDALSLKSASATEKLFKLTPDKGYRFFCLSDMQVAALLHAVGRLQSSVREAEVAFYGPRAR